MKALNRIIKLNNLLPIIFSSLFLFGIYKIINDFGQIIDNISKITLPILSLATFIYFLSVILRYIRWKIVYLELFENYKFNMINETIIGYMANNLLPFRLGELYRVNRISKKEHNSFVRVLSTIFTERLFDVVALVLLLVLALPFVNQFDFKLFELSNTAIFISILIIISIVTLLFLRKIIFFEILIQKLIFLFNDLLSFFYECRSYKKYLFISVLSILIWIIESIVYYVIADYFILDISRKYLFTIILIVCSITNLSGIIPSLPGNLGNFEFFGTLSFLAMGISSSIGATVIIIVHLVLFIPISILGFIIISMQKLAQKK
ncbi:MAG: hypothetical protein CL893_04685 [Dehalococcoidia bacterium]|nr:hypothetical protein [Dehalococcoidia bacterium]